MFEQILAKIRTIVKRNLKFSSAPCNEGRMWVAFCLCDTRAEMSIILCGQARGYVRTHMSFNTDLQPTKITHLRTYPSGLQQGNPQKPAWQAQWRVCMYDGEISIKLEELMLYPQGSVRHKQATLTTMKTRCSMVGRAQADPMGRNFRWQYTAGTDCVGTVLVR